jgi:hypothetical protein
MIWLTLLPFALVSTCGLATIPLCGFVAFLLLGETIRKSWLCSILPGFATPLPPGRLTVVCRPIS